VVKNLVKRVSSREDSFLKTLFTLSRCSIAKDYGSENLLSQSKMQIDEWDEVGSVAQQ
jgi:ABC-type Fe3+-citrate transport system substrate-binding protein